MGIYVGLNILIVIIFLFFKKNKALITVSVILIMISGFRGDFTVDYSNYRFLFDYYKKFAITDFYNYKIDQEIGYFLLNKIVQIYTNKFVYLNILISIIIITLFSIQIKKDSKNYYLSIILFVNLGQYYTSFNIMRQILAVAIVFSASKFLYKKSRKTIYIYSIIILLASLIHKSALIMLIFYFLSNIRISKKKLIVIFIGVFIILINTKKILNVLQKYFYSNYHSNAYGMTGLNFNNIVVPVLLFGFIICFYKKISKSKDKKINIWFNASIMYVFFKITGTQIEMIERFSNYFNPYILLLVPYLIEQIKDKKIKIILIILITLGCVSFNYITLKGTGYDPFYFIKS